MGKEERKEERGKIFNGETEKEWNRIRKRDWLFERQWRKKKGEARTRGRDRKKGKKRVR